ncbi:hypothetical protein OG394_26705 [Kribbella sp. NBC_01245]|uniref:hypothetical protein n=1 Tax=Kribbella sp. NBC_01245 TaxID=2903578 RepID=UPI002E292C93|nr:hypothetical protein [Kribbella sp. NBC_01245]
MVASLIVLCSKWNPLSWPGCVTEKLGNAIKSVFSTFWDFVYGAFAEVIADVVAGVIKGVGALWIYVPTLHASEGANYTPVATVSFMRGQVMWIAAAVAMISMIIGGVRMAYQHNGESARELLKGMLTLVVVTFGGLAMVTVLTEAGDLLAQQFINRAVDESKQSFADSLVTLIATPMAVPGAIYTLPVIIILGFVVVLMSFIQIMLMLARNGMLILLVGILPLAAAATNTEMGKSWFKRICGWLIAFIAYKPFAALIYATAILLASSKESLINVLTGVMMMALSIIALPALLRLVSPPGGS